MIFSHFSSTILNSHQTDQTVELEVSQAILALDINRRSQPWQISKNGLSERLLQTKIPESQSYGFRCCLSRLVNLNGVFEHHKSKE